MDPAEPVERPIRLYTLGRFEVAVDGEPLRFSSRGPRKPVELLKALLARGGRGVSQQTLCEQLWPDAEGDAAYRALVTTVHRLRRLLRCAKAISFAGGQLAVCADVCWVDAWQFERILASGCDTAALARAIDLYRGRFLGDEDDAQAFEIRDRLQRKLVRAALTLGHQYVEQRNTDAAIRLFEQVLDAGALSEEIHRDLMACLATTGHGAAAAAVYHRCRVVLAERLGMRPSIATEQLYRSLNAGARELHV